MGLKQLEAAILAELKEVAKNNAIRQKDIMEWQSGKDLKAREGETLYYLPKLGVSCAVKLPAKKVKAKGTSPEKAPAGTQTPDANTPNRKLKANGTSAEQPTEKALAGAQTPAANAPDRKLYEQLTELATTTTNLIVEARRPRSRETCSCNTDGPCAHHAEMLDHIRNAARLLYRAAGMVAL